MRRQLAVWVLSCLAMAPAMAIDVEVVGLFPGKVVLMIDGAAPRAYAPGDEIPGGVKLLGINGESASVSIDGKRQTIRMGEHVRGSGRGGGDGNSGSQSRVVLQADQQGHFLTQGMINGVRVPMLVDTGATLISMSASDATRLGIDYKRGQRGTVQTANGAATAWRVRLDTVRVGDIELSQVDAAVHETSLPFALLGMSFLNRTEMRQDSGQLTLTKRY